MAFDEAWRRGDGVPLQQWQAPGVDDIAYDLATADAIQRTADDMLRALHECTAVSVEATPEAVEAVYGLSRDLSTLDEALATLWSKALDDDVDVTATLEGYARELNTVMATGQPAPLLPLPEDAAVATPEGVDAALAELLAVWARLRETASAGLHVLRVHESSDAVMLAEEGGDRAIATLGEVVKQAAPVAVSTACPDPGVTVHDGWLIDNNPSATTLSIRLLRFAAIDQVIRRWQACLADPCEPDVRATRYRAAHGAVKQLQQLLTTLMIVCNASPERLRSVKNAVHRLNARRAMLGVYGPLRGSAADVHKEAWSAAWPRAVNVRHVRPDRPSAELSIRGTVTSWEAGVAAASAWLRGQALYGAPTEPITDPGAVRDVLRTVLWNDYIDDTELLDDAFVAALVTLAPHIPGLDGLLVCAATVSSLLGLAQVFEALPNLTIVDVGSGLLSPAHAEAFATALRSARKLKGVHVRGIDDPRQSPGGFAALCPGLVHLPELQCFHVTGHSVDVEGARSFAHALRHTPHMESLHLQAAGVDDAVLEIVAGAFVHVPMLHELDLTGNPLGPRGAAALARGLPQVPQLRTLVAIRCELDAEGAVAIAGALGAVPLLETLHVSENVLGPAGCAALAAALVHVPGLQNLSVASCGMDAAAAGALSAGLHHVPRLSYLTVTDNALGPDGVVALAAALPRCPALTQLDICRTGMGLAGALALAAALPFLPCLTTLGAQDASMPPQGRAAVIVAAAAVKRASV